MRLWMEWTIHRFARCLKDKISNCSILWLCFPKPSLTSIALVCSSKPNLRIWNIISESCKSMKINFSIKDFLQPFQGHPSALKLVLTEKSTKCSSLWMESNWHSNRWLTESCITMSTLIPFVVSFSNMFKVTTSTWSGNVFIDKGSELETK